MLRTAALLCLLVYAGVTLVMFVKQRGLQYFPENKGLTPEGVGLAGVEVNLLRTPDGERIVTWYKPAEPGLPTILYFHGNAGEIGDRPKRFAYYADRGFGVLYVSYRGFGGSTGDISESGLVTDAAASYDWLVGRGVKPGKSPCWANRWAPVSRFNWRRESPSARLRWRLPLPRPPISPRRSTGGCRCAC